MRLDDWGAALMVFSTLVVAGCLSFVFLMEQEVSVPWLVLGHGLAMVGAVGVKVGYIMRLEASSRAQI